MDYLQLVNKVLEESGKEMDPLTVGTWSSAEAGRRLYPRVKRLVAEAWKMIQIKRNEWEFNSAEFTMTINPKMKFAEGSNPIDTVAGGVWVGDRSGVSITLTSVTLTGGDWADGDAFGQVEFSSDSMAAPVVGETFSEAVGDGTFEYTGSGSYHLFFGPSEIREPRWNTFTARRAGQIPANMIFVPWTNYLLGGLSYAHANAVPVYFSQDYMGDLVFHGQSMQPFSITFVYDVMPQQLTAPEDIPTGLPTEYHEWIAWAALMSLAHFDKDPDLYAYAEKHETLYRQRAERNLMPLVEWEASRFNHCR